MIEGLTIKLKSRGLAWEVENKLRMQLGHCRDSAQCEVVQGDLLYPAPNCYLFISLLTYQELIKFIGARFPNVTAMYNSAILSLELGFPDVGGNGRKLVKPVRTSLYRMFEKTMSLIT